MGELDILQPKKPHKCFTHPKKHMPEMWNESDESKKSALKIVATGFEQTLKRQTL